MARDYKTRATPKQVKKQTSGWIWFFAGLLLGLFAAGLIWLKFGQQATGYPSSSKPADNHTQQQKSTPFQSDKERSLPPKPRFDFYTVLPEMEIVIPDPEPDPIPSPPPTKPAATKVTPLATHTADSTAYMLQMGSFRKYGDADRLKASLALIGIQAEIQKVTINNKDTYHRVRSGPYHSRQQANQLRAQLQKNNVNTLLIKLKR